MSNAEGLSVPTLPEQFELYSRSGGYEWNSSPKKSKRLSHPLLAGERP
jgi:hypothetical protein